MTDALTKNALGPLVLRLALAAIFIYHGLVKVSGPDSTWGASWAVAVRQEQAKLPGDLQKKMEEASWSNEKKRQTRDSLKTLYAETAPETPASLQYHAVQIAVAWGELLGGGALLLGILTRWAAAGLLIIQVGAILTVTAARGFSFEAGGGFEFNLALAAMCLTLILVGGGTCSVGYMLRSRRRQAQLAVRSEPAPVV